MNHEACFLSLGTVIIDLCRHELFAEIYLFTGRKKLQGNKATCCNLGALFRWLVLWVTFYQTLYLLHLSTLKSQRTFPNSLFSYYNYVEIFFFLMKLFPQRIKALNDELFFKFI